MPVQKEDLAELTINQLSTLSGSTYRTVKRRLAGLSPIRQDGKSFFYPALPALLLVLEPEFLKRQIETEKKLNSTEEKARLDKARADQVEMENEARRLELLPRAEVEAGIVDVFSNVRARLLGLPNKAAPALIGLKRPAEVQAVLVDHVYEALKELAIVRIHPELELEHQLEDGKQFRGGDDGIQSAAEDKGKRLGRSKSEAKRRK